MLSLVKHLKSNKQNFFTLLLLVALSLPAIFPLFNKGFFVTDDGEWMMIRFSAFHQTLRDGEFPVRFLGRLNQEYGYPVANFLYPGFMYLAEPIHLIGFGFVDSIKIVIGISMVLSGLFAFLWLRKLFAPWPSIVGSLFYLYTPYHMYDLYKRGSVGELLALAVVPFILWQIERKSLFWSSLGLAFLIISHNTLALLFFPLIIFFMIMRFNKSKEKRYLILNTLYFILFSFGLSAFFWIPALFELQYTVFSQVTVSNWKEYFATVDVLGYSTLFVVFMTVFIILSKRINIRKEIATPVVVIFCLISLFFATSLSSPLWNVLPVGFVQFPFRFLSVSLLCVAFLAAANLSLFKGRGQIAFCVGLLMLLLVSSVPFIKPGTLIDRGEGYYATNMGSTTVLDEYMPVWVKEKPTQKAEKKVEIVAGEGKVQDITYTNKKVSSSTDINQDALLQVHTIYWPGWEASVDGKSVPISYNNERGLIEIAVPQGQHRVEVEFGETALRMASNSISLISFVILLSFTVWVNQKKLKKFSI